MLIPFSGIFENKILDMDEAERTKYFEEHKVTRLVSASMVRYNDYYVYPVNVCGLCRARKWEGLTVRRFPPPSLNPVRFAYVAREFASRRGSTARL